MMHNNQDLILYLEAIDTIRKEKGLSIEALIEDNTSERSYRRYMNQELSIPLQTLEKAIKKYNIDQTLFDLLEIFVKVVNKNFHFLLQFPEYSF